MNIAQECVSVEESTAFKNQRGDILAQFEQPGFGYMDSHVGLISKNCFDPIVSEIAWRCFDCSCVPTNNAMDLERCW